MDGIRSSQLLSRPPERVDRAQQAIDSQRLQLQGLSPPQLAQLQGFTAGALGDIGKLKNGLDLPPLPPPLPPPPPHDEAWLRQQLGCNPQALEAFEALSDEQKQALLRLTDQTAQPGQNALHPNLARLLAEGKLTQTDSQGKSLLDNLSALTSQPRAEGLDGRAVLQETLTALGPSLNMGTPSEQLANRNPAEYARLVAGLTSPEGKVTLAGGQTLQRPDQLPPANPFFSRSGQILEASLRSAATAARPDEQQRAQRIEDSLRSNPEVWQKYQSLPPEQRRQFAALLDSDYYQDQVTQAGQLGVDPPSANPALISLLMSDKLTSTDSRGNSLLDNLTALRSQQPGQGFDSELLFQEVVNRLAFPIRGGIFGGKIETGPLDRLAQEQPSEFVRLAAGLGGSEGKVELANGDTVEVGPNNPLGGFGGASSGLFRIQQSLENHGLNAPPSQAQLDGLRQAIEADPKSAEAFAKLSPEQQEKFLRLAARTPASRQDNLTSALGLPAHRPATLPPDLMALLKDGKMSPELLENLGAIGSDAALGDTLRVLAHPDQPGDGWQSSEILRLARENPAEYARLVSQLPADDPRPPAEQLRRAKLQSALERSETISITNSAGESVEVRLSETGSQNDKRVFQIQMGRHSLTVKIPEGQDPIEVLGRLVDYWSQIPEHLRGQAQTVIIENGRNPADASWAETYGIPGFTSAATAGGGTITFWNGVGNLTEQTFNHEMGHLIGERRTPAERQLEQQFGPWGRWPRGWEQAAQADGNHVSEYATHATAEDFAESWAHYLEAREQGREALREFRLRYPHRAAYLDAIYENRPLPEPARKQP
ncbi:MAG: hypothetical protein AB7S38_39485 [Vulcanimicrobiota bacterium]